MARRRRRSTDRKRWHKRPENRGLGCLPKFAYPIVALFAARRIDSS